MAVRSPNKDDFDAPALARQVDDHAKDMASIVKRLDELESKFGTSEKIGDTLCATIGRDTSIHEKLEGIFSKLLVSNEPMRKAIIALVDKSDRDWFWMYGKRLFHFLWSLIMIAVGVVITVLVTNYSHSTPTTLSPSVSNSSAPAIPAQPLSR